MRVLVCGGRAFRDREGAFATLDALAAEQKIEAVIHGDADGADRLAGEWARLRGIKELAFPADWVKHGRAAGPIRNKQMLDEGRPALVVAFPGGRGTANMVKQARGVGVAVQTVAAIGERMDLNA